MSSSALSRWILASVLITGIGVTWWMRSRRPQYSTAYVGDRSVTVWSSPAQVRRTVATLDYGDKVSVVRQGGELAEIRTASGTDGWIDPHLLITPQMWERLSETAAGARLRPIQAVGHTRAFANVHVEPNRDAARLFQFGANVPVVVLDRRIEPRSGSSNSPADNLSEEFSRESARVPPQPSLGKAKPAAEPQGPKEEAWLLVLRVQSDKDFPAPAPPLASNVSLPSPPEAPAESKAAAQAPSAADRPIAGWVLARLIELDPPAPLPDYASASDLHPIAWVTLNSVPDLNGPKPQYLLAGTHHTEPPGCDFNEFRVFTWSKQRQRYETAYIGEGVCGHLPILVQQLPEEKETDFFFGDPGGENNQRRYEMRETIVRPIRQDEGDQSQTHAGFRARRHK